MEPVPEVVSSPIGILLTVILLVAILSAFKVPVVILEAFKFVTLTLLASNVPVVIRPPSITVVPCGPRSFALIKPSVSVTLAKLTSPLKAILGGFTLVSIEKGMHLACYCH